MVEGGHHIRNRASTPIPERPMPRTSNTFIFYDLMFMNILSFPCYEVTLASAVGHKWVNIYSNGWKSNHEFFNNPDHVVLIKSWRTHRNKMRITCNSPSNLIKCLFGFSSSAFAIHLHVYWSRSAIRQSMSSSAIFTLTHWPWEIRTKFYICNFKWILVIDGWGISCEIALIWMSLDVTDDQSTLVQVLACWQQAITWTSVDPDLCAIWRHWATMLRTIWIGLKG